MDKLKITVNGVVIVDQTAASRCDFEAVTDEHQWTQLVQTEPCVDRPAVTLFGRGNRASLFDFSVERFHASPGAAFAYKLSHPYDLPAVPGVVVFQIGAQSKTFPMGIFESVRITQDGATTVSKYSLKLSSAP